MSSDTRHDFLQIYQACYDKVLACAAKLIGRDDADDVANEVFIKIARSLDTLADHSRLTSWVFAITLNTVRDFVRHRASGTARLIEHGDGDDGSFATVLETLPDRTTRTPEEVAVRDEMVACYLDFVNRLPPTHYEVYALSEFDQLTNAEIAERLEISLATVKIRLHRARTKLHEELRCHCRGYYNERGELMGAPKEE